MSLSRSALEKANKENEAKLSKNKALNDATTRQDRHGCEELRRSHRQLYQGQRSRLHQAVIFSQMARLTKARQSQASDAADLRAKEVESWKKAIALDPNNGAITTTWRSLTQHEKHPDARPVLIRPRN